MELDDLIRSFPLVRIRLTRQARPKLASEAPKVSRFNNMGVSIEFVLDRADGMNKQRHRIIISIVNRAIRRCFRCMVIVRIDVVILIGRRAIKDVDIAKGI